MKVVSFLKNLIKKLFVLLLVFIIFQLNISNTFALQMNKLNEIVVEELRLSVPLKYKETWLKAEEEVWEPWLAQQEGFLGRQIFYNVDTEEALLLVSWKSRYLWKNIKTEEVNKMQSIFEENIKKSLEIENNPFELIYEGELFEQKWS